MPSSQRSRWRRLVASAPVPVISSGNLPGKGRSRTVRAGRFDVTIGAAARFAALDRCPAVRAENPAGTGRVRVAPGVLRSVLAAIPAAHRSSAQPSCLQSASPGRDGGREQRAPLGVPGLVVAGPRWLMVSPQSGHCHQKVATSHVSAARRLGAKLNAASATLRQSSAAPGPRPSTAPISCQPMPSARAAWMSRRGCTRAASSRHRAPPADPLRYRR